MTQSPSLRVSTAPPPTTERPYSSRLEPARNPYLPPSYDWRRATTSIRHHPDVHAMGVLAYGRITVLLDLASESRDRWKIRKDTETLRSELGFSSETALAAFMAKLVNKELFYALAEDGYMPAPVLCPHEPDYPAPPTLEESIANLATHSYETPEARLALRDAQTPAERQAVKNKWPEYEAALRAADVPLPDPTDTAAYKAAKAAFVLPFLDLYAKGQGMKPDAALEEMLNRFEREQQLRDMAPAQPDGEADLSRNPNVTKGDSAPFVTSPAPTALEREKEKTEDRSDSNNSFSSHDAARVTNENPEAQDLSRNPNVTKAPLSEAEQKAVVVELLCEIGVATPDGLVATLSRAVVEEDLLPHLMARGRTLEQIHEIAQRQGRLLPFRQRDRGDWGGLWKKSILGDWTAPDAYKLHEREEADRRRRADLERQRQAQAAQAQQAQQQASLRTQAAWEALSPGERQEVLQQAGARLVDAWRKKWNAYQEGKGALSKLVLAALNREIESVLRLRCELPALSEGAAFAERYTGEEETGGSGKDG